MIVTQKIGLSIAAFLSLCLFCLASCTKKSADKLPEEDRPVVSVFDETLYQSDVAEMIPDGLSKQDSLRSAEAFIQKWINDQLVYKTAKDNITDKDKIDEMVENYRRTLVTYTYLEDLLKENLSKSINNETLQKYYDGNKDKLILSSNLVKGIFLKIPKNAPQKADLLKWYRSTSDEAKESIEKYSLRNTVDYDYFYDQWKDFREISAKLPIPIADSHQFLQSHKSFECSDSLYIYLINIQAYRLSGSVPPFEYAKSQVTDLIMNEWKEKYLQRFEKDIYKKAIDKKNIKFYKK